jgi:transcriptional regulator with XRE-family HTH domain
MPNLVSTKQLKAARALAGLTQDQLGAAMGLNGRMVRFWERRIPTNPRKLVRLEQALMARGVVVFSEPSVGAMLRPVVKE